MYTYEIPVLKDARKINAEEFGYTSVFHTLLLPTEKICKAQTE